jgi:hypothetical protein
MSLNANAGIQKLGSSYVVFPIFLNMKKLFFLSQERLNISATTMKVTKLGISFKKS